jgi:hypothetical protein
LLGKFWEQKTEIIQYPRLVLDVSANKKNCDELKEKAITVRSDKFIYSVEAFCNTKS